MNANKICYIIHGDYMKIIVISDIHGLVTGLDVVERKIKELNIDKLVVLGDIYYSGIRNMMHKDYNPDYIESFLRRYKNKLICIRGNCDSDEDVKRNNFIETKKIDKITIRNKDFYFTHGHLYNENNWYQENTVLVFGHYHIPFIRKIGLNYYINPGSLSLPRGYDIPTYLVIDEDDIVIYDINDNIIEKIKLEEV